MFSGIIEHLATIKAIKAEGTNLHFDISTDKANELYIDQSIAHNGVCLTIVDLKDDQYTVTAIEETLNLSSLGALRAGDVVNIERCITPGMRLDGHMVQGHVDTMGEVCSIETKEGSWYFEFKHQSEFDNLIVSKGSVAVNGVSLTVVEPKDSRFKVAIIPYTFEHTNFHTLKVGDRVNLEFDIIGKYVARQMANYTAEK